MRRRTLLIRTLTQGLGASVLVATGWLMGTRTLTMPKELPPCDCIDWYDCTVPCVVWPQICYDDPICAPGICKTRRLTEKGCWGAACECRCDIAYSYGNCGSCNPPCFAQ